MRTGIYPVPGQMWRTSENDPMNDICQMCNLEKKDIEHLLKRCSGAKVRRTDGVRELMLLIDNELHLDKRSWKIILEQMWTLCVLFWTTPSSLRISEWRDYGVQELELNQSPDSCAEHHSHTQLSVWNRSICICICVCMSYMVHFWHLNDGSESACTYYSSLYDGGLIWMPPLCPRSPHYRPVRSTLIWCAERMSVCKYLLLFWYVSSTASCLTGAISQCCPICSHWVW